MGGLLANTTQKYMALIDYINMAVTLSSFVKSMYKVVTKETLCCPFLYTDTSMPFLVWI